ncbi:peptide chain release factor N(5)-glutamine methyltransferase [Leucobacter salsicius]|uniref:peptide chain release factor N(5)-glutamine methyltransferase n=1 Tax=Leucobacter salsicius TaxID=664638 RepID=UPI000375204B|nr:peptide chain release factor N(5)-glutamine methyltransferase [Leucobacter salsicius]
MAQDPLSLQHLLAQLSEAFQAVGIATPEADAELLAGHVLGESRGRVQALAIMGRALDPADASRLLALGEDRASRVPLQHLTGRAPFRQLELRVGPGVFVPRPETEMIAQLAIDELNTVPDPIALDLCTGSGAIALAMANEVPEARVWAVEKSPDAHAWAGLNVATWGDDRVTLLLGDVTDLDAPALKAAQLDGGNAVQSVIAPLAGKVAVLASNPPYIPSAAVPVDPEVRDHDPELALYSGDDGLDLIRVLSRVGLHLLAPGGLLVLEHTEQQGAAIRRLLERDGWHAARTHPDLTGRERATTARSAAEPE